MQKNEQYEQAVALRRRGFTYSEIAKLIEVSKSTVHNWFLGESWSQDITEKNRTQIARDNSKRISLLNKARGNQSRKLAEEAERAAAVEFKHYKTNPLFIAGVMLYVSQGDLKNRGTIRLSHTQMHIHRTFIRFAEEYLGVSREKVRFWLLLYPEHKEIECTRLWSRNINIHKDQFHKTQYMHVTHKGKTLHSGVGNTIIGGTVLKRKLMKWVELASKEW